MGRPLRIEYPGALYHITSRGIERRRIFLGDPDRVKFLGILDDYHERYGILIHSYVLMDNHYHLVLETPRGNLLKVMHGINGGYTGYFNRRCGRTGHLFQGRYKGILVDKDSYLLQLSRYVHLNPVTAKIVEGPAEYRWSSYGGYISKRREFQWVEYGWVLSQFGRDKEEARKGYKKFVEQGLHGKVEDPFKEVYGQVVLGGEEFKTKIRGLIRGRPISQEIVERKRFKEGPSAEDVVRKVARAFGIRDEVIVGKGERGNMARKIAIYLVKRWSGLSNEEIGGMFGKIHYSAVSKGSARLEMEMARDKRLAKLIGELESQVKT
jgi:REP element-mobilizing transposase RayT